MSLKMQKIALVLGASRGIGSAVADEFLSKNIKTIVVARSFDLKNNQNSTIKFRCDLENSNDRQDLLVNLVKQNLIPDIIVHNVGGNLNLIDPLMNSSDFFRVIKFNLETVIETNNIFIPYMKKKRWGRIVHTSSIAALENQGPPSYCAAKAALNAYVRSVGRYVAPFGISMSTVMPGAIFTSGGYWDEKVRTNPEHVKKYLKERMAIQRFGNPNEISKFIGFLCSEDSSFVVGSSFLIDGGQGRVFNHE